MPQTTRKFKQINDAWVVYAEETKNQHKDKRHSIKLCYWFETFGQSPIEYTFQSIFVLVFSLFIEQ